MAKIGKTANNFVYGRGISASDNSDKAFFPQSGYTFATGIVTDCIVSSSKTFLKEKLAVDSNFLNSVKNPHMLNKLAPNSIIVSIIDNARSFASPENFVALPFFSPHFSMPIKPGEYVWLMIESDNDNEIIYWVSRKHGIGQVDDINYTFLERTNTIENVISKKITENSLGKKKTSDIQNPEKLNDEIQSMHSYLAGQLIESNTFNSNLNNKTIIENSIVKNRFKRELVPKKSKNPGDLLLQGSNNSHIQLTTEKFSSEESLHEINDYTPAIDICVGRKKNEIQSIQDQWFGTENLPGVSSTAKTVKSSDQSFIAAVAPLIERKSSDNIELEFNKVQDTFEDIDNEKDYYDADPLNCGGRLYLSKNCKIDNLFGTEIDVLSSYEGASIISYSDHNRIAGNQTVRIVNKAGESFIDLNELGDIVLKSSIEDGQQFLSLANASDGKGISRLQARDEIHLAVSSDDTVPSEPYVLYSELRDLLDKITGDLAFYHMLIEQVIMKGILAPLGGPAIMSTLEGLRSSTGASSELDMVADLGLPETVTVDGEETTPDYPPVSTTFLGGNITLDTLLEDISTQINEKLKSTKIFGEAND
tara:strand:+ start:3168 stop:4940 length:1773 start_codon:yes stop_codon:yes gene_type:complete